MVGLAFSTWLWITHKYSRDLQSILRMKIMAIKEEGDTSNVNQVCDVQVEKEHKIIMRAAVDTLDLVLGININQ